MARIAHRRKSTRPPWEQARPKAIAKRPRRALTAAEKATAKRHAKAAGRPYPNLVDNMSVLKARTTKKA